MQDMLDTVQVHGSIARKDLSPHRGTFLPALELPRCWLPSCRTISCDDYVRSEVLPPGFNVSSEQLEAVITQYRNILGRFDTFSVRHVFGWNFPDGNRFPLPYFVFSSQREFGLARISHGMLDSPLYDVQRSPYCVIELLQGIKGVNSRKLPIRNDARPAMLQHILGASSELHRAGWTIALRKTEFSGSVREPYFRSALISTSHAPYGTYVSMSEATLGNRHYHLLNDPKDSRAVRRILGFT